MLIIQYYPSNELKILLVKK